MNDAFRSCVQFNYKAKEGNGSGMKHGSLLLKLNDTKNQNKEGIMCAEFNLN